MAQPLVGTTSVHVPRQGPGGVEVEAAHHGGPQPAPGLMRRRVPGDRRRGYGLGGRSPLRFLHFTLLQVEIWRGGPGRRDPTSITVLKPRPVGSGSPGHIQPRLVIWPCPCFCTRRRSQRPQVWQV